MKTTPTTHPTHDHLAAFNAGRLGVLESAEIERHLADCEACCRLLKTLPDETLVSLLGPQSDTKSESTPSGAPEQPLQPRPALDVTIAPGECKTQTDAKPITPSSADAPAELQNHPRYRIESLLGRGGMGSVYQAQHRLMNRPVALKVIDRQLVQTPGLVERFHREVQAAAKLAHPNIVTAYDAEQAGDLHFLVMELVEGQDLAEIVRQRGKLPIQEACEYVRQAAQGLQHAYERGMVHRDIKPQNLMLQASPDASAQASPVASAEASPVASAPGVIKILDFGLAQFATEIAETSGLTQVGAMMGTPDYMAPEQARDAHSADIRADIYSLGCTLYCLLSGGAPFPQGSIVEKVMAHVERQPLPLQELRDDVPPKLAAVLAKMMAKAPGDRFQTPAEVAEALLPFASSGATKTPVEVLSPIPKATARQPRSPLFIATSVLGVLATVILLGVIVIVTDQGRIEVRSEVDDVELIVKRGGQQIDILDAQTGSKVKWYYSGKFDLELKGNRNDIVIHNDGFQLTRWGKQIVTLTRKPELKGSSGKQALAELTEIRQFKGHQGPIRALAWLPDGKKFLSGSGFPSGDKTLRLWDRDTGREVRQLKGHSAQVYAVDVNRDGDRALAVCDDKTIHLWNLTTGEHLKEIRGHSEPGTSILFCPDGRHALFASHDKTVKLLDLESGTVKREFTGHTGATFGLAILPGNRQFLSGSWDGTIRLWDLETAKSLGTFAAGLGVWEVKILPDGARFLSAGDDGTVQLWEISTGKQLWKIDAHPKQAFSLDVSPDGRYAASGSDGLVCLWNVESGELVAHAKHNEFVWDVEFAPDGGRSLLSAGGGKWKSEKWDNGDDWVVRHWGLPEPPTNKGIVGSKGPSSTQKSTESADAGWTQLFNGKDLTGWRTFPRLPGKWQVKEGILIGSGDQVSYLGTEEEFDDFHLSAEVRINTPSDAGIYFRAPWKLTPNGNAGYIVGYEAQIGEGGAYATGDLAIETGNTQSWQILQQMQKRRTTPGEWFHLEVLARGAELEVKIDGQTAAKHRDKVHGLTRGHIAIQFFQPGTVVEFRSIKIKTIPRSAIAPFIQPGETVKNTARPPVKQEVVPTGTNLITDPSLEATAIGEKFPTGWGSGNLIPPGAYQFSVAEGGKTGKRGWLIEGDGQYAVVPTNRPGVDRALRYGARGWVRLEAGSAQLKILYFDGNGRYLGENRSAITNKRDGWHQLTMLDDLAKWPEARHLSLALTLIGKGKAVFDDLEFTAFDAKKLPANFEKDYASTPKHHPSLFDRWAGRWETTTEYKATAVTPAKTMKGETIVRKVLDDQFLLWQWKDESGDSQYLSLLGFDENTGNYRIWIFGSAGEVFERTGQWDAVSQTLALDLKAPSPGVSGLSTDRFTDKDHIESLILVKDASGQITRDIRATWTRKAAPLPADIELSGGPAAGSAELSLLQKMAGDWTIRSTSKPSVWEPKEKSETFTEQVAWTNSGRFLIFRAYDEAKQMTSLSLMTYEPKESSYHFWTFAKGVYGGQWRITWDASSRAFHWRSIDMPAGWVGTGYNRWVDDDTFDNQALIKDENGRVLLDSTQEKRRKK